MYHHNDIFYAIIVYFSTFLVVCIYIGGIVFFFWRYKFIYRMGLREELEIVLAGFFYTNSNKILDMNLNDNMNMEIVKNLTVSINDVVRVDST